MRKIILLPALLLLAVTNLFAQNETRITSLLNTAKSLDQEYRANFTKAIIKAKEKGWPLVYKSKNNNYSSLVGIDESGQPVYYTSFADPVQAITVNSNLLWPGGSSGFNLSGNIDSLTNRIGVWDEASPRLTHKEFTGRLAQRDNVTNVVDHPTHVAGIIMGAGVNPLAKGMAYGIKGAYSYDWNNDESEMANAAAAGLLISNHSYGSVSGWDYNSDSSRWEFNGRWNEKEDYKFGLYESSGQTFDSIAYNAPFYLIVKSAGNNRSTNGPAVGQPYWRRDQSGKLYNAGNRPDSLSSNNSYGILPTDANAKNILTVGAITAINAGYLKPSDAVITGFSSWGPTDDGRIKPDIVTDGQSVYSAMSANDSSYAYLSGTSMAAPGAAGSLLLLQELSQRLKPSKFIKSATLKGLAIHTANEAGLNPGPDYKFGWGVLNMSEAATVLSNALTNKNSATSTDLVYDTALLNGQSHTYTVIASGSKSLKATIVWTDVKGSTSTSNLLNDTTRRLVNDLDIVISKSGNNFYPWTLNRTAPENAATKGINYVDNVEKVELDSLQIGKTYSITVNHKGALARGQQTYSLIVSGAGGTAYCASTPSSSAGTKMDSISLNNIQFVNASNNQYIDNTQLYVLGEPSGTIPVFIKLGSADASNATRFVKIFIDYNNNGVFETNEIALTSAAQTNGNYTGTISLPSTIGFGNFMKMRIVAMETSNADNVLACGTYAIGETQDYTLKVTSASNDLQVNEISNPTGGVCKKGNQYVSIKLSNLGSIAQTNIPLNLTVKKGNTTILNINEIFNARLNGLESMSYTFQRPIPIDPNATYAITATANNANDQQINNNTVSSTFVSAAEVAAPNGSAVLCNGALKLIVNNPIAGNNYYWYDTSILYNPIATATLAVATTSSNKVYLTQGYQNNIPPLNNTSLGNGSYNVFSGNFMKFNATKAMTIENTKLYTAYPGKVDFILGTLGTVTGTSYTYTPIQTVSLNVAASSPSPTYGPSAFVAGDTGRVYNLNFKVPAAGEYIILIKTDSAALFRNNNAPDPTYPVGPAKAFSFTGNSVDAATSNFQNYFYFFYNSRISTNDCVSAATNINIVASTKPTITQVGDSLTSSNATVYQWFMNDSLIQGATNKSYKPVRNAVYKVVTISSDCENVSDNKLILVTDVAEASAKEINLKICSNDYVENLIRGTSFYIQFSNIQTQDISLEIMNAMGTKVFQKENLLNQKTPQRITVENLNTGIYFVKVYANKKVYIQRVFITNN